MFDRGSLLCDRRTLHTHLPRSRETRETRYYAPGRASWTTSSRTASSASGRSRRSSRARRDGRSSTASINGTSTISLLEVRICETRSDDFLQVRTSLGDCICRLPDFNIVCCFWTISIDILDLYSFRSLVSEERLLKSAIAILNRSQGNSLP